MDCPKCKQPVEASGELDFEGMYYRVFQCENKQCESTWKMGEKEFPVCFTFAVSEDGEYFDPESMEPINVN